jgi:DNA-binding winged helix-turn-helix (wHTH) protein
MATVPFTAPAAGRHDPDPARASRTAQPPVADQEEIAFGDFLLVPRSRVLLCRGAPVPLGSRAFELLQALLKTPGQLVAKEDLVRQVWPTTFVEESNLRFQMAGLRKALGGARDLIKTVPGRGYIFTGRCGEAHGDTEGAAFQQPVSHGRAVSEPAEQAAPHPQSTSGTARLLLESADAGAGAGFEDAQVAGHELPAQSHSCLWLAKIVSQLMTQQSVPEFPEARSAEAGPGVFLPVLVVVCSRAEAKGDPLSGRGIAGSLDVDDLIASLVPS